MPAADMEQASKKRKPSTSIEKSAKKPRPPTDTSPGAVAAVPQAQDSPLFKPHAAVLQGLASRYNILPASVISSTPIRRRLVHMTSHLLGTAADGLQRPTTTEQSKKLPRATLLYARPSEVCKMITVAEKCKRILEEQGQTTWYQYNQLFDLPGEDAERARQKTQKKKRRAVEETVLHIDEEYEGAHEEDEDDDSESDAFETMQSRFEKAVLPPPPDRTTKSLRIFLSTVPIPELKAKDGVTVQSSEQK